MTLKKQMNVIKSLNYNTQLNWMKQMYDEAHVPVIKSTHDNQSDGTHHAEWAGVNDSQIHSLSLLLFKMFCFTSMQFETLILNVCQSFSIICFRFTSDLEFWMSLFHVCIDFLPWRSVSSTTSCLKNHNHTEQGWNSQTLYFWMSSTFDK